MRDPELTDDTNSPVADPIQGFSLTLLGLYFLMMPVVLCALAIALWPFSRLAPTAGNPNAVIMTSLVSDGFGMAFSMELSLILLVIVSGALGSYIHSATSFADYVGNRRLGSSWIWWYVLRAYVGLSLALIFYFVVRGGLLSGGASASDINPFGVAAVSGLVGMFSKQATDKLRELFDTLFKTERPVQRADRLANPVPEIQAIAPTSGVVGGGDVDLTVIGNRFIPSSMVKFNGVEQKATYVSPSQLRVRLPATLLDRPGSAEVTVFNPPPGGGASPAAPFTIQKAPVSPPPAILNESSGSAMR